MTEVQPALGTDHAPSIFIVEDETVVAKHIEQTLLDLGYRVLGRTGSGSAAVAQAVLLKPDLILMDIGLPGDIDGVAAAAAIREQSSIPVVFLSALSDVETLDRAGISGPFGYVVKPFRQADLLGAIEIALHRCRTEGLARGRERLLLMTLQSIGDGVVTTNEKEEITFLNPVAERMTGWSLAEASGRQLADVMPMRNESTGEPVAPLRLVLDERRTTNLPKGTLLVGRSETLAIIDSAAPILADEANLLGAVLVFRDASEQQRLEEQLRCYQKMEVVGQLTSAIAHDFNNILSAILLYSRFLSESLAEDDPRRQDAVEIEKAGQRGAVLTRQLLSFGQRQALDPAVLNLNEVVAELRHMLGRLLATSIQLSFDGAPDLGSVTVDRGQIEQVIVNLIINARDAMPRGGTLHIETNNVHLASADVARFKNLQPGRHVVLVIRDSGCGMDAETQRRAFEPFFTTKEHAKGTGLGLSTSYDIVKHSGGEIGLTSEPGRGTVFSIYLPRTDGRAVSYTRELAARRVGEGAETILLIENDSGVRQAVARMLEWCGYQVLRAPDADGASAIAESHDGSIQLLLSDVMARGSGSAQPFSKLQAHCGGARVLYMSSHGDDAAAKNHGAHVIRKPFSSDTLARTVRKVLDA